jgi:hypothetical protein
VTTSSKQLSALSRLFSSTIFRELATKGKSAAFSRLAHETGILSRCLPNGLVRDVFETAFKTLKQDGLRDEYIYKAALTHRVLMGKHSLRTACMLSEFRVGECKADIAILNGTTTVYEIKSERDSLSRLERQIENYRKVFASVFVIAGENHVDAVLATTPADVGVMSLDRRYYTFMRREAKNQPGRICPLAVLDALRTNEAMQILIDLHVSVPNVPNTLLRSELRKNFERLHPEDVHAAMLRTLKRTRDLQPLAKLVGRLPDSLHAAALSISLRKSSHDRLVSAVNTPLKQAMAWS